MEKTKVEISSFITKPDWIKGRIVLLIRYGACLGNSYSKCHAGGKDNAWISRFSREAKRSPSICKS